MDALKRKKIGLDGREDVDSLGPLEGQGWQAHSERQEGSSRIDDIETGGQEF